MRIISVDDCACHNLVYYDGTLPRYFTDRAKAVEYWLMHVICNTMFWGCHLNNKHILNILDRDESLDEILAQDITSGRVEYYK